jgi:hypothetical protein
LAALGFGLWHAGELDAARSAALKAAMPLHLPQFDAFPERVTREGAAAAGLDAPWWWLMSAEALETLLTDAGWRVQSREADGPVVIVTATP